jgi:hypothetical protein
MGHTQKYKSVVSKKKRRTQKRTQQKIRGGTRTKQPPTKCQTQRTRTLVSKRNTIKLLPRIKLSSIARRPIPQHENKILNQIISNSQGLTFVSADSLYALIFKMRIEEPGITVGGQSIKEFIIKLCIISPEGILYPRTWFRSEKKSYDINKFQTEHKFLLENSVLGICPKPIYYDIFGILSHKEIFKTIVDKIPDRQTFTYVNQLWKDLKKVKSSPSRFTNCGLGLLLMEFIPGESAKSEIDNEKTNDIMNWAIVIKILYKLILLYVNGFIHLDCHLNNIIMRPITDGDPHECLLDYPHPKDGFKRQVAEALSLYDKTAILIDFGDVAPFEEVFPDEEPITVTNTRSIIRILRQIMGIPSYDGWFTHLNRATLDSLISNKDTFKIFDILYDYYRQNTPF